jgi:DNA primase
MMRDRLDALKQQVSLLGYLQTQGWTPARRLARGRLMGLCPLHADHQPSFLVDGGKQLFYCYGCGAGGDVIRFIQLYHRIDFRLAVACLRTYAGVGGILPEVDLYYQTQLHRHPSALAYVHQRGIHDPEVIHGMRIGYAPGGCLRAWMTGLGYRLEDLRQAGLINALGYDTFCHRLVFPLATNLYGRSLWGSAPHRFLPGGKGGLYDWENIRQHPSILLVEGLFDLAALRQAGFGNVTCSLGNHLSGLQWSQLCDGAAREVYIVFDGDESGRQAARQLARRLWIARVPAWVVGLPEGQDPNSFFAAGGEAGQFQQ